MKNGKRRTEGYSYPVYLREHGSLFVIFCLIWLISESFLLIQKGSVGMLLFLSGFLAVSFFLGTYLDFRKWQSYFFKLSERLSEVEQKYLVCEMLEPGESQEERFLKKVFLELEQSMNNEIAHHRRNAGDYKEYTESWIHEIKLPIATAKMILANTGENGALMTELDRMEGYVEQALYYARSNDVEKDYLINAVLLSQVLKDTILRRKRTLRLKNAGISLHDTDFEVYSDSKWLQFIFGQIIDNSIKYTGDKPLVLEIYCEERENSLLLHMKDNGIGMSSTEVGRAFDKGFTGTNGRKNNSSTGIGLYLCRKLCNRLHHGIFLSSVEGCETTVTFSFPKSGQKER